MQWRADGRTRKQTLGRSDAIPLPRARELARPLLDGLTKRAAPDAAPTVAAFSRRYLKDLAPSWKPATQRAHSHDVEHLIMPYLGSKRLNQVTRADLVSWKDGLPGSAASGNRALAVLSGMMRHAELLGLQQPGSNPCKGLRRNGPGWELPCGGWRKRTRVRRAAFAFSPSPAAAKGKRLRCGGT